MRDSLASEIAELESIISRLPEGDVITRMSFQDRLEIARREQLESPATEPTETATLVFRGKPVDGSHGIAASFAGLATKVFSEAFNAVCAGFREKLSYMGPISRKHDLVITGTAVGSFGFRFEVPNVGASLETGKRPDDALEKVKQIFRSTAEGSDEEVAEVISTIHPRAVRKVRAFLEFLDRQEATCGLEFRSEHFKYRNKEQLKQSIRRLKPQYIREEKVKKIGSFKGFLPDSRTFEFEDLNKTVLKGRIGDDIEFPDVLNRDWLNRPVAAVLLSIQVGDSKPRYVLESLDDLRQNS